MGKEYFFFVYSRIKIYDRLKGNGMERRIAELRECVINSGRISREILWANIFQDTVKGSEWLVNQAFSPGRAAIGYPTLYALYRILDEYQPRSILEMGLGQSTKMIGSYIKWKVGLGEEVKHYVVEHDKSWIAFFNHKNEVSKGTEIVQLDLVKPILPTENGEETYINMYQGFGERFQNKKFDMIFIDGPFGSPIYSRVDIIDLLPECLNESWIIMLDDAERDGEQNTLQMITNVLKENSIEYVMNYYSGEKATAILTSRDLHFLCTM